MRTASLSMLNGANGKEEDVPDAQDKTIPLGKRKRGVQRLNFVASDLLIEALKEAQVSTGATSIAEVMKNALRLYLSAVRAAERGEQVVFRPAHGGGIERIVDVPSGIY